MKKKDLERALDIASKGPRGIAIAEQVIKFKGEWRDQYFAADGTLIHDTGWRPNQIQNSHAVLLASLAKNQAGFAGYLYFALGTGLASWDSTPPTQPFSDTTLTTEVFRKSVPSSAITFRDAVTFADIDPTPSNVIQLDVIIGTGEANGNSLREFGVFGGDATSTLDSGLMANWIVHGKIDKTSSISIQRAVRYTYQVQ